jgi:hypothetical protein
MGGDSGSQQRQKKKEKSQTQTQQEATSAPWQPAQPALQDILKQAQGIQPMDTSGFAQGLSDFGQGLLPQAQGGLDSLSRFASGDFVGQNDPELQGLLSTINQDVMRTLNGEFDRAGRSVGGQYANAAGRGIASGLAAPLFNNLQTGRAQQLGASGSLANFAGMAPGFLNSAAASPYAGLNAYSNLLTPIASLGGQTSGTGTSNIKGKTNLTGTPTETSDPLQSWLGTGIAGVGALGSTGAFGSAAGTAGWLGPALTSMMAFSDRRLKEDIEQVGELYDGTPVYRFRYKGHPMTVIGLMADEVTPEAVFEHPSGYKMVDYKIATEGALAQ